MRPNRAPQSMWLLRKGDWYTGVRTLPDDLIGVIVNGFELEMTRNTARLMAVRINQCLDETRL